MCDIGNASSIRPLPVGLWSPHECRGTRRVGMRGRGPFRTLLPTGLNCGAASDRLDSRRLNDFRTTSGTPWSFPSWCLRDRVPCRQRGRRLIRPYVSPTQEPRAFHSDSARERRFWTGRSARSTPQSAGGFRNSSDPRLSLELRWCLDSRLFDSHALRFGAGDVDVAPAEMRRRCLNQGWFVRSVASTRDRWNSTVHCDDASSHCLIAR